jgi:CO/xanthine dehydrogenase FAD-binding subunit
MIADFEYFAPKTVEEALSLLTRHKDSKIIAGGQSLLVVLKQRFITPAYLIDIKNLAGLDYIKYDYSQGLKIGALTVHRAIEKNPVIRERFSVLSEMENNVATIQTRNWGTIGGNLCHGDPAGDPAAVFIVLQATLWVASPQKERIIDMEKFSRDYLEVALKHNEMLIEIQVPNIPPYTGVAYRKLMVMKGDMGIVGAAVSITLDKKENVCRDARIALSNAASVTLRARHAEKTLIGNVINDDLLTRAGEAAAAEADPPADVHGSSEYRREMVKVFVKRVARLALEKASAA